MVPQLPLQQLVHVPPVRVADDTNVVKERKQLLDLLQLLRNGHQRTMRETSWDPSFSKTQCNERSFNSSGGRLNSIWPIKSMERKMLHQVGRPLENVSDVAKQIVGLARLSASPYSTALV